MWYKNNNGDSTKPDTLDAVSSNVYNYVRKDFVLVPETTGDQPVPEHWEWLEAKISKEDWTIFEQVMGHESALDDVYAALTELAELIEG